MNITDTMREAANLRREQRNREMGIKITHSYRIQEAGKRIHLQLLDENGRTFAVLDLSRNKWSQLAAFLNERIDEILHMPNWIAAKRQSAGR